jgi:hypothetical protein
MRSDAFQNASLRESIADAPPRDACFSPANCVEYGGDLWLGNKAGPGRSFLFAPVYKTLRKPRGRSIRDDVVSLVTALDSGLREGAEKENCFVL